MKKLVVLTLCIGAAGLSSCRPQLAESPLPPQQEDWAQSIKSCYPSWERPKVVSPYTPIPTNQLSGTYDPQRNAMITPEPAIHTIDGVSEEPVNEVIVEEVAVEVVEVVPVVEEPKEIVAVELVPAEPVKIKTGLKVINPALLTDGKYKIVANDNLWNIALKVYGKGHYYKKILEANPTLDPKKVLRVGSWIVIPGDIETATPAVVEKAPAMQPQLPEVPTVDTPAVKATESVPAIVVDTPIGA